MLSRCGSIAIKSLQNKSCEFIKIGSARSFHKLPNNTIILNTFNKSGLNRRIPVACSILSNRHMSSNIPDGDLLKNIPEPPAIPVEKIIEVIAGAEPTFASQGLGGWSPVGMVENSMEFLHVGLDIPWWGAIVIGTIAVRCIIFPLVIISQRNSAKLNNNMPQMQFLQAKMTEARLSGNALDSARYGQELAKFMESKDMSPFKNVLVPLVQAPLFLSFLMGLRSMANTPVESMREGGILWFTDLTVCDQFYLLPIITSVTMFLTIQLGTESVQLPSANFNTMKYVLRAIPFCILPLTVGFPGAILCYWASSNFISLLQVGFLRIPSVRQYFKIEKLVTHKPETLSIPKKGFVEGVKTSWANMKISKEIESRNGIDEIIFQRAGKGALVKTYKHDPTKAKPIQTKQRQ